MVFLVDESGLEKDISMSANVLAVAECFMALITLGIFCCNYGRSGRALGWVQSWVMSVRMGCCPGDVSSEQNGTGWVRMPWFVPYEECSVCKSNICCVKHDVIHTQNLYGVYIRTKNTSCICYLLICVSPFNFHFYLSKVWLLFEQESGYKVDQQDQHSVCAMIRILCTFNSFKTLCCVN